VGEITGISWCHHTWNPWWGCQRVSPGCEHCYAETLAVTRRGLPIWGPPATTERKLTTTTWRDPLKWDRKALDEGVRRRLFVASMADVFEDHPQVTEWRRKALEMLATLRALDVLLLTKRPQNIPAMVPSSWLEAWPSHVWIGTTVEDQRRAEERVPALLKVPAAVRFLSMEPLLEAVDLSGWLPCPDCDDGSEHHGNCRECGGWGAYNGEPCRTCSESGDCQTCNGDERGLVGGYAGYLSWVIVGGESGHSARPFDLAWARSIVRQCREASVPVFVKQVGDNPIDSSLGVEVWLPGRSIPSYMGPSDSPTARAAVADGLDVRPLRMAQIRAHHGSDPSEWPDDLRVQQFPEVKP